MPWFAAAAAAAAAPSIINAFKGGPKAFPDTYAYKDAFNNARNSGWMNAANQTYNVNPQNFQYDPTIAGNLNGIAGGLQNYNYTPDQVGGGMAGQNFGDARNQFMNLSQQAGNYLNAPLVSATAQQQGIAQALAAQRSASLSGPNQFNQALASRNAALGGGNAAGQAVQAGILAQQQEALGRQQNYMTALTNAGSGLGALGQQQQYGQIANQGANLDAEKLGINARQSAADIYGNLGNSQLNASQNLSQALQAQANADRAAKLGVFQNQAQLAQDRLNAFVGYSGHAIPAGQAATGAAAQAGGILGYGLGNYLTGNPWQSVGNVNLNGNFGNQLGNIFGGNGAGGSSGALGNYQLGNPANNPAFQGLF